MVLQSTLRRIEKEEALPQAPEAEALPNVGHLVVYHPRPGEFRMGRTKFPALVMATQDEERTLDLVVFYDRDDSHNMQRVPEVPADGSTLGWSRPTPSRPEVLVNHAPVEVLALQGEIETLKATVDSLRKLVLGSLEMPEGDSVLGILDEHEDRVQVLEKNQTAPAPKAKAKGK